MAKVFSVGRGNNTEKKGVESQERILPPSLLPELETMILDYRTPNAEAGMLVPVFHLVLCYDGKPCVENFIFLVFF